MKQYIQLNMEVGEKELLFMHPQLLTVLAYVNLFAHANDLPFKVTSIYRTPEHNELLGSVSKTHTEYRAFDLSLRGWPTNKVLEMEKEVEGVYGKYGAISASTGKSNLVVIHNSGHGYHGHFQIKRGL